MEEGAEEEAAAAATTLDDDVAIAINPRFAVRRVAKVEMLFVADADWGERDFCVVRLCVMLTFGTAGEAPLLPATARALLCSLAEDIILIVEASRCQQGRRSYEAPISGVHQFYYP